MMKFNEYYLREFFKKTFEIIKIFMKNILIIKIGYIYE